MKRALFAVPALLLLGCGPDLKGYCEAQEKCYGGNDKDIDACVAQAEAAANVADDLGCDSEFGDYVDCLNDSSECTSEVTGQNCQTSADCGGFGGSCSGGKCVMKKYDVKNDEVCKKETQAFRSCTDF